MSKTKIRFLKNENLIKNIIVILIAVIFNISLVYGQIISQYIETDSGTNPKGIEIWNNTDSTLDFSLNNLVIKKGTNGGIPSDDFTLSTDILLSGDVVVIGSSDLETVTTNNGSVYYSKGFTFNGDDALEVWFGTVKTDVLGIPESDPGSEWTGNGVSTKNQNIKLKSGITVGDTSGWTDPSLRFETVSTNPSGTDGKENFGLSPTDTLTIKDEPTNHVTNFSLEADEYDKINITWTENDGIQAPDGYLIVMSDSYNMMTPLDSVEYADNDTIKTECGIKNIQHGTRSYTWKNLNSETDYYAKIYTYTNSGEDINYKTDGTIPTANDTTEIEPDGPVLGELYITEVCGDGVNSTSDDGYVEIYNKQNRDISLRGVKVRYYNSNPGNFTQIVSLDGVIESKNFVIITQNKTNFDSEYSVTADFVGTNFYFNGGDDGIDIYSDSLGIIDCFNDNGTGASSWDWDDNFTYNRLYTYSGADTCNWTQSSSASPKDTNGTNFVGIKENKSKIIENYILGNTYPNPFNPTFTIPLQLNKNAFVNIQLINILGQKVMQIKNSQMNIGEYKLNVNCENLTSGIYFVKVKVDNNNNVQKIVLVK